MQPNVNLNLSSPIISSALGGPTQQLSQPQDQVNEALKKVYTNDGFVLGKRAKEHVNVLTILPNIYAESIKGDESSMPANIQFGFLLQNAMKQIAATDSEKLKPTEGSEIELGEMLLTKAFGTKENTESLVGEIYDQGKSFIQKLNLKKNLARNVDTYSERPEPKSLMRLARKVGEAAQFQSAAKALEDLFGVRIKCQGLETPQDLAQLVKRQLQALSIDKGSELDGFCMDVDPDAEQKSAYKFYLREKNATNVVELQISGTAQEGFDLNTATTTAVDCLKRGRPVEVYFPAGGKDGEIKADDGTIFTATTVKGEDGTERNRNKDEFFNPNKNKARGVDGQPIFYIDWKGRNVEMSFLEQVLQLEKRVAKGEEIPISEQNNVRDLFNRYSELPVAKPEEQAKQSLAQWNGLIDRISPDTKKPSASNESRFSEYV